MQRYIHDSCAAGKITGPLPWDDAEEVGSPGSVRSPGLVQLLAPRHQQQQQPEQQPQSPVGALLQDNSAADWTAGPPAPEACAQDLLAVRCSVESGKLMCSLRGARHRTVGCLWLGQCRQQRRCVAAVVAGSPPRSSSSGSVPDYIGDDLGHALSTPERLRPDSAW
jgi:hypothetical protein